MPTKAALLPTLSAIRPLYEEPTVAPTSTVETTRPFNCVLRGDTEVPREVVQRGVDDAEVVAEGERAEARDEHARQNPHEQLAALQGLKLGFGLTSLEVGGG